jgi:hypothetical protein
MTGSAFYANRMAVTQERRCTGGAPHHSPLGRPSPSDHQDNRAGNLIEPEGAQGATTSMPRRTDKPGSVTKMSKEDAERLRELLRRTEPADMSDPSVRERVGKEIAKAMHRPFYR